MIVEHAPRHAVAVLGVAGARGEPALCVAIETTWVGGVLLETQPEVELAGTWHGEPGASTPRDPPTSPVPKAGCDVILRGHALRERVEVQVGPVGTVIRVHGNRTWQRRWIGWQPSEPAPWERIPLLWERCVGGTANPLGCGPRADGVALPNLESAADPKIPAGTDWTLPSFAHRRDCAAFDPRGANAAAPGLIADVVHGDEAVLVSGCSAQPWAFRLPNPAPPHLRLAHRRGDLQPTAVLDTVLLDADAGTVRLTWRAWVLVGGHELVSAVEVA
jgi:hypothetical protein